jgi:hypothetical protein
VELKIAVLDSECQILFLTAGEENNIQLGTITSICAELDLPLYVCNAVIVDASSLQEIDAKLLPHTGNACRPRLLLAGSFLEEQITLCALRALYVGFEVFLLKDFVVSKNLDHMLVYDMRLFQAGVVPSTLRQLLYEWMSGEERLERRAKMIQLLDSIDKRV